MLGLEPVLRGGGQELGRRAGTENVAGIAGFGAAAHAAMVTLEHDAARLGALRSRLEGGLRRTPGIILFSGEVPRLPNTVLFTIPGLRAETAVIGFDLAGIAVSSGSACLLGKVQPSHVLEAMGFGPQPRELCVSVWAGPRHPGTLIAASRLGLSLPVHYVRIATKHCLNGSKAGDFLEETS